jgi:hypothetical protein
MLAPGDVKYNVSWDTQLSAHELKQCKKTPRVVKLTLSYIHNLLSKQKGLRIIKSFISSPLTVLIFVTFLYCTFLRYIRTVYMKMRCKLLGSLFYNIYYMLKPRQVSALQEYLQGM